MGRGGGGRVEDWLWPSSKYRLSHWQGTQSFTPNVNPECKLLTAYVGHFCKATCVTHGILEVGVKTNSQHSQSHRVLVSPQKHPTLYANVQLPIRSQSAQGVLPKAGCYHCYVSYMLRRSRGSSCHCAIYMYVPNPGSHGSFPRD